MFTSIFNCVIWLVTVTHPPFPPTGDSFHSVFLCGQTCCKMATGPNTQPSQPRSLGSVPDLERPNPGTLPPASESIWPLVPSPHGKWASLSQRSTMPSLIHLQLLQLFPHSSENPSILAWSHGVLLHSNFCKMPLASLSWSRRSAWWPRMQVLQELVDMAGALGHVDSQCCLHHWCKTITEVRTLLVLSEPPFLHLLFRTAERAKL